MKCKFLHVSRRYPTAIRFVSQILMMSSYHKVTIPNTSILYQSADNTTRNRIDPHQWSDSNVSTTQLGSPRQTPPSHSCFSPTHAFLHRSILALSLPFATKLTLSLIPTSSASHSSDSDRTASPYEGDPTSTPSGTLSSHRLTVGEGTEATSSCSLDIV